MIALLHVRHAFALWELHVELVHLVPNVIELLLGEARQFHTQNLAQLCLDVGIVRVLNVSG